MINETNFDILVQYPKIEFSYETITHKKIPSNYDICLAIPHAKKYIIWFTFHEGRNKCVLMELNRSKIISEITVLKSSFLLSTLYLGTILFGSIIDNVGKTNRLFVVEDIYMYQGVLLNKMVFGEKLGIIEEFLNTQILCDENRPPIWFYLPFFWKSHICEEETSNIPLKQISYPLHHIQYRSLNYILPFLNVIPGNDGNVTNQTTSSSVHKNVKTLSRQNKRNNSRCEQTNYVSTFIVMADLQTDVYNLHAYDDSKKLCLYDVAYIPNCKSSVYMNSLFRNIKENQNIDLIEESDNEDDFEDTREDKYVDTKLELIMDCVYHTKFRRWVPIKVVSDKNTNVILMSNLPII
jgi:hypothetical protein